MDLKIKTLTGRVTGVTDTYVEGYASVQVVDTEGDLIEIDGIDLSLHSDRSPLKLLPSHAKELPDGMPPVLGVVTNVMKTTYRHDGEDVPALYFRANWADNDIARAWKKEYADGTLDSFSVGSVPVEAYKTKTGINYTKTKLAEISCCVVPANPLATVARSLGKYLKDDYMDKLNKSATPDSTPQLAPTTTVDKDMGDNITMSIKSLHGDLMKCIQKSLDDHQSAVCKTLKDHQDAINDRMDGVEASLAELVGDDEPDDDDVAKKLTVATNAKDQVDKIAKALSDLRGSLKL